MDSDRQYIAIDLKSFYASIECVERGIDPLDACLVVADAGRTEKTICLAVSPALKAIAGLGGRPRLFEVVQRVSEVNFRRGRSGKSSSAAWLAAHPECALDYIVAPPRMALYMEYSRRVIDVYLKFVAPEDLHPYSVDEVFIDATSYLPLYGLTAHEFATKLIREVLACTGVTATAGIGTNMYLCKVAMDIVAKKMPPDKDGVRIAGLDELSYRRELWDHRPLTDFWRVGRGIMRRLQAYGIHTMGDIARCSIHREDLLYQLFGVNAELLIDHAWGWEPVTMDYVKSYEPETHSLSSGQVLHRPYTASEARTVALEMADNMALKLLERRIVTDQMVLEIGYDVESLRGNPDSRSFKGKVVADRYGRLVPAHGHGSASLDSPTSSGRILMETVARLFDRVADRRLLVRRLNISVNNLQREADAVRRDDKAVQLDIFADYDEIRARELNRRRDLARERDRLEAVLQIKKRFGKNAILRGLNYCEGATQRERNAHIGGHKA